MDITKTIAANLDAWMEATPSLDTIKKVSARSGVGFGTVRRARNGDGNTTIQNLAAIAKAFRRPLEDLIRPGQLSAQEPRANDSYGADIINLRPTNSALLEELLAVASRTNDRGLAQLIERGQVLAAEPPRAKANPAK